MVHGARDIGEGELQDGNARRRACERLYLEKARRREGEDAEPLHRMSYNILRRQGCLRLRYDLRIRLR